MRGSSVPNISCQITLVLGGISGRGKIVPWQNLGIVVPQNTIHKPHNSLPPRQKTAGYLREKLDS